MFLDFLSTFFKKALGFSGLSDSNNHSSSASEKRNGSEHKESAKSEVNETGTVTYYAKNPHGLADKEYRFYYKKVGDSWRAYILRTPSLRNRDASGYSTYRIYDRNGSAYVSWNYPVKSLADMQAISKVWADYLQEYIATGNFGENQG